MDLPDFEAEKTKADALLQSRIADLDRFTQIFTPETDRGAALLAAALMDDRLEELLLTFMDDCGASKKLFEGSTAPFGTFSSRCHGARALGLISQIEYEQLAIFRSIRNEIAHSWDDLHFELSKMKSLIGKLRWSAEGSQPPPEARKRFSHAAILLIVELSLRAMDVEHQKRKEYVNLTAEELIAASDTTMDRSFEIRTQRKGLLDPD